MEQDKITSLSKEKRVFKPKEPFSRRAYIKSMAQYQKMYNESVKSPEKFWAKIAEDLYWFKRWKRVREWKAP
jgi:acetyl-CoA synthetase